jgi:hypothetical protein
VIDRIRREPVLIAGLFEAVLALRPAFGLDLTPSRLAPSWPWPRLSSRWWRGRRSHRRTTRGSNTARILT